MAADNELVIKISGDPTEYKKSIHEAEGETDDFKESLSKIAEVVAFAELTKQVFETIGAFHEQAAAIEQVKVALENQGLAGKGLAEEYLETAEAIEKKTGADATSILQAQASAQALLGQKEISAELTKGVVDFAAAQRIDVASAFALVARAANNGTEVLKRHGLTIADAGTSSQRLADITKALTGQFDGTAERLAKTQGSTALLAVAFEDLQKKIGEKLVPVFDVIVHALTDFINLVQEHDQIVGFAAAIAAGSVAVGGLATLLITASLGLGVLTSALGISTAGIGVMTLAVRTLIGATGLGLLVLLVGEIALNWNTVWPAMKAVFATFTDYVISSVKALGTVLEGVFSVDPSKIKQGVEQYIAAVKTAFDSGKKALAGESIQFGPALPSAADNAADAAEATRLKKQKAEADERARVQAAADAVALQKKQVQRELLLLEDQGAAKDTIDLKKQELALLGQLEDSKNTSNFDVIRARLERIRALQVEQGNIEQEQQRTLNEDILKNNEAFQALSIEQQKAFLLKNKAALEAQENTKLTVLQASALKQAQAQIKLHNEFLENERKYGTAYATLRQSLDTEDQAQRQKGFDALAELQTSNNGVLKAIGQAAAVEQITIKTAQAAMDIYAGFSTIPIIGVPLAIAGAAAAVAFGGEQIAKVYGAADGGLVQGGTPGVDSVPFMLQQNELVAPAKNFEEVVGSVAASREAQKLGGGFGGSNEMLIALQNIADHVQNIQPSNHITVKGDVLADNGYIAKLGKKLSDAVQYQNLKLPGIVR